MKRTIKTLAVVVAVALAAAVFTVPAFAETIPGPSNLRVTFGSDGKMSTNFEANEIGSTIGELQPGDTTTLSIALKNDYKDTTNWYLKNEILESLEESTQGAYGGAYGYHLSYVGPDNQTTMLFSSDTVGGGKEGDYKGGLKDVNNGIDDFFYIGQLNSGQSGKVELAISLEGETQGNAYQNARLADIQMQFAVDIVGSNEANRNIVYASMMQTGDQLMSNLPILLGLAGAGLIVLIIALVGLRKKKRDEEGVR